MLTIYMCTDKLMLKNFKNTLPFRFFQSFFLITKFQRHEAFQRIWKKCYSDCLQMTGIVDYLSFELKQYCVSVYLHLYKHLSNSEGQTGSMLYPSFFTPEPPSVYQWVSSCLKGEGVPPYPYLPGICERSRLVVLVCIQHVAKLVCFVAFSQFITLCPIQYIHFGPHLIHQIVFFFSL